MSVKLLFEIVNCKNISNFKNNQYKNIPCAEIIKGQSANTLDDFQIPEPWNGNLKKAKILFISSNPSIDKQEKYPTMLWNRNTTIDFFENRFNGKKEKWVKDGIYVKLKNGDYKKNWVRYWAAIRKNAEFILKRKPIPGIDYAITELVHCKSKSQYGVKSSLDECTNKYLKNIIKSSDAKLFVGVGSLVREYFMNYSGKFISDNIYEFYCDKRKIKMLILKHPNARGKRKIEEIITQKDINILKSVIA